MSTSEKKVWRLSLRWESVMYICFNPKSTEMFVLTKLAFECGFLWRDSKGNLLDGQLDTIKSKATSINLRNDKTITFMISNIQRDSISFEDGVKFLLDKINAK